MLKSFAIFTAGLLICGSSAFAASKPKTHNRVQHLCGQFEVGQNLWKQPSVNMWKTETDGPNFDVDQSTADAFSALRTPDSEIKLIGGYEYWGHPDCACVNYLDTPPVKMAFPPDTYYNVQQLIGLPTACPHPLPEQRL